MCPYQNDCKMYNALFCDGPFSIGCYIRKGKDEEKMENNTLEKVLNMADSATKLAANLSEAKKESAKPRPQTDDNSNKASTGSQSVNIHMDTGKKKEPKPVEKHIHEFPENRPLTEQECDLALKKAQMEYELNKEKQAHLIRMDNLEWQHQLEKEKKEERKGRIRKIVGGILIAIGAGGLGYSFYKDYKNQKNRPALPAATPVKAEGDVK